MKKKTICFLLLASISSFPPSELGWSRRLSGVPAGAPSTPLLHLLPQPLLLPGPTVVDDMPAGAPSSPLLHLLSSPSPSSIPVQSPPPLTPTPHRPTRIERARAALVDELGDAWRTSSTASPAPQSSSRLPTSLSPKYWFSADPGEVIK